MKGINKAILVGNLGNDPEVRATNSGQKVVTISVATSESWKDKQTGQPQQRTEWHRVVFYGKLADIAEQYLKKGSKVYIEGQIKTHKWQGNDGRDNYTTQIHAKDMQMLDSRGESQSGSYQQQPAPQQASQQQPGGFDDFDDDIPFS